MKKGKILRSLVLAILALCLQSKLRGQTDTVMIGGFGWATENLDVSTFRNGDMIKEAKTNEEWKKASKDGVPAWCYSIDSPKAFPKRGKLYNWYAVSDPRGLAPEGWHIPTDTEWEQMRDSCHGIFKAAIVLIKHSPGLEGGYRMPNGEILGPPGSMASWWMLNKEEKVKPVFYTLEYGYFGVGTLRRGIALKGEGLSVRCIKD